MKGSAKHPILWQKRNEWLIDDDPQTDWQQMQSLLDMHMPVSGGVIGRGRTGLSGGISGIKLISAFIVALSAATIVYFIVRHNKVVDRDKQLKQKTEQVGKVDITATNALIQPASKSGSISDGKADNVGDNNSKPTTNTSSIGSSTTNVATGNSNSASTGNNKAVATDAVHGAHGHGINADKKSINAPLAKAARNTNTGATLVAGNSTALSKANNKSVNVNTQGSNPGTADKNKLTGRSRSDGLVVAHSSVTKTAGVNSPDAKIVTGSGTAIIVKSPTVKLGNRSNKAGLNTTTKAASHSSISHRNTLLASAWNSSMAGSGYANKFAGVGISASKRARHNKGYKAGINQHGRLHSTGNNGAKSGGGVSENQLAKGIAPNNSDQPISIANTTSEPQYYGTTINVGTLHFTTLDKPLISTIKNAGKLVQVTAPSPVPDKKPKNTNIQKLEIGILAGVNAPGSFTAKSQNANFYGSLPIDGFLGVFANYTAYKKWGINIQPKMLSPQSVSGTYSHIAVSKIDSGKTFVVTDSRKIYFVDVPLHLVYNATPNISLMGGAAISFPIKDANGSSILVPNAALKDSAYYVKVRSTISATKFSTQPNLGLSGGVSFHYRRLYLNTTYLKALKPQTISSDLGSYNFNHDALQFSLGIRLK